MTKEFKEYLLFLARSTIAGELGVKWQGYNGALTVRPNEPELKEKKGTFVTLTIDGELRGCIGQIVPSDGIEDTVRENALSAGFYDPRFSPLSAKEFTEVKIEISILSKPEEFTYNEPKELINHLKPNVHGLIIKFGGRSATFLPQVWEDLPQKEAFLGHLCLKAGLDAASWNKLKLQVFTYTVEHFEE